ncbi:uncharacterized protein LOC106632127 [Geospiza fortis]|uniref:Uncharacterized protein LOC106632127 n=1 Tax=Geospiza fortis TaxID=48883 RepID=A0A6I9Z9M1_GEOFO|nr:uncharacterized protein LOC106632127 [Geospiza fortis]
MENEADAKVAIENLNGKEVKGRRVNVELSTNVQKKGTGQAPLPALGVDKTKRIGLEYREKFQPKIEGFDQQRRAADAAFPSATGSWGSTPTPGDTSKCHIITQPWLMVLPMLELLSHHGGVDLEDEQRSELAAEVPDSALPRHHRTGSPALTCAGACFG